MAKKTKFFRIAVEGVTTDGREISRDWIQQMAKNYDPQKYGARVFAEHIRGSVPDGPFRAFGDVVALKAEEITDGALKGKLGLYAQIDPSEAMVKLINSGQKIYSSIEVDAAFADTKQAYLVGLGITDSPASLGTEVLAFAAKHPDASPFKSRKRRPENLFSAAAEANIELEPEKTDDPAASLNGFFANFAAMLAKFAGHQNTDTTTKTEAAPNPPAVPSAGGAGQDTSTVLLLSSLAQQFESFGKATTTALNELRDQMAADRKTIDAQIDEIKQTLDNTPASYRARPAATGSDGTVLTDC